MAAVSVMVDANGAIANTKRTDQATVIAIVDFQQVTRESRAGASIRRQVNEQRAVYQGEIKRLQDELKTEQQYLQESKRNSRLRILKVAARDIGVRRKFQSWSRSENVNLIKCMLMECAKSRASLRGIGRHCR